MTSSSSASLFERTDTVSRTGHVGKVQIGVMANDDRKNERAAN
jgi:hypothetical protein